MFKTVVRHMRFVEAVLASVFKLAGEMGRKVARRMKPYLRDGERVTAAQVTAVLRGVGCLVEGEARELREAETEHSEALRKERRLRKRRKKDAAALYQRLLRARLSLEAYGRGTAAMAVGLDKGLVRAAPDELERYAGEAVGVLSKPDFELPPSAQDGVTFHAAEHAKDIRKALRRFVKTDEAMAEQVADTRQAQKVKVERLERFKKSYRYGKWVIEGFYGLAGEEYHLERLVPKRKERPSREEEGGSEGDAGETEDGVETQDQ